MTTTTFVDEVTVIEASWLNDVNADVYGVRPVATGGTGATNAADARTNLGLGNVDNTSDANKPVSTAQQAALNLKANILSPSFTTPSLGVATATSLQGIIGNVTPAAGTFTTLTSTGNAALGDAEATDTHAVKGATTVLANSASAALTVTQTGAGNAFVVEDSASTDATPFVIDSAGSVGIGSTVLSGSGFKLNIGGTYPASGGASQVCYLGGNVDPAASTSFAYLNSTFPTVGAGTLPTLTHLNIGQGAFTGSVTNQYGVSVAASLTGATNNYGFYSNIAAAANRFNFYAAGTADNYFAGKVGIGAAPAAVYGSLRIGNLQTGGTVVTGVVHEGSIAADVTATANYFGTFASTSASAFTLTSLRHFFAQQGTIGAGSTVTNQSGFESANTLIGATNNLGFAASNTAAVTAGKTAIGFYSAVNIATGGGTTYGFYAAGTAANYFAGDVQLGKTVTAGGTTGAQTINKTVGTVNFAAAATSLVVTNSLVTANSIITATVGTNDTTMKSVAVVAAAGSFTLHANAAATAETRVNFHVFN